MFSKFTKNISNYDLRPRDEFLISNVRRQITFERRQPIAASKTLNSFTLPTGNYEFPFKICIGSSATETITGINHEYHSYKVQGVIERRFGKDFVVSQPIRVYKYLGLETNHPWPSFPESIENQRDENIHYNISIPDRNIPFGSSFPVEFWLTPLSKDIQLAAIEIQVLERHSLRIEATAAESVRSNVHFLTSRRTYVVFSERHDLTVENYETPNPEFSDVEWRITKPVHLPLSMDACSQSIRLEIIKIAHVLTTTIELRTLEGCISTITESIPFDIFMSPDVVGENGAVHGQDIEQSQSKNIPPPPYGAHTMDLAVQDSLEGRGDSVYGNQTTTGINIGQLPDEQNHTCQVLENVPSYESDVCMVT
ncbi:uncharacterized protein N7443_002694 [Penicillium atrosanguineum]|uniref:uncharacterized protein n=1 Tax=Penicillium atrosanguineum TaxID=1132637 RepID=UPI0023944A8D|nr:uncharacterized protein N7443_002694 [Penicillium atrosanguineum]KAJ5122591.1 hypothetical protein N7526_009528 [Penicillium atrosanguineum]KAJ5310233.1 hypothetical protein N7443_002694 [Penicillium atrosanguineum]